MLAEGMVDQAGQLADLVGGDWSDGASWATALTVTEGFLGYWEDNRAVFRVVDLATEEGDGQLRGVRVRALNAVTVALAQVIATASPAPSPDGGGGVGTTCSPAGSDPMAVAGTLVAMFASVSAHRYGFEFWVDPDPEPHRHAGPHPALGRHGAAGAGADRPAVTREHPATHRARFGGAGAAARRRGTTTP